MQPVFPAILDQEVIFDPAGDFDAFVRSVPAKWAVYLLVDETGRPVQLLSVKNLRYSLKHRLGGDETIGLSKRVDYRQLVRRVFYRRVDSAFEADWIYYEAARQAFPKTYQGMVGFRPAWFVHVDPEAAFPRFVKTCDLSAATTTIAAAGRFIGPLEDKHAAQRLIELAEDSFDLCRYYNILVEAPNGRACAYKEMGKCPAPCDGSISLPQYRRLIEWAADTLVDPAPEIARHTDRMKQAASALKFETASRIKQLIEQLAQLGKGPFRHARLLSDFSFVTLQRGPSQGQAKIFLITPGQIAPLLCQTDIPEHPADALRYLLNEAAARSNAPFDPAAAERIGIVAHHLFSPKSGHGAFIPLAEINEKSYLKAYKDVLKQKPAEETENEGVMKELQSME